ncbi:DUF3310 domain-containing protein [Vulcanococcus sp.]|uniref:DUF3310 domain-containing protein n=1 Tax=Vulcanococcus sp. TaxID=2856995 RepID=UPI003C05054C
MNDPINPNHYTQFSQEVIDTLEDWIKRAPDPVSGALQFNAGKYLARMWDKGDDPVEHINKAIWYLNRLALHLQVENLPFDPGLRIDYDELLKDYGYQTLVDEAPDNSMGNFPGDSLVFNIQ